MISYAPHAIRCLIPVFQQAEKDLKNSTVLLKPTTLGDCFELDYVTKNNGAELESFPNVHYYPEDSANHKGVFRLLGVMPVL